MASIPPAGENLAEKRSWCVSTGATIKGTYRSVRAGLHQLAHWVVGWSETMLIVHIPMPSAPICSSTRVGWQLGRDPDLHHLSQDADAALKMCNS